MYTVKVKDSDKYLVDGYERVGGGKVGQVARYKKVMDLGRFAKKFWNTEAGAKKAAEKAAVVFGFEFEAVKA